MGLRRTISTGFWEDGWIELLTPVEKLLFIYLFSCPATNPSGLFKISLRRMSFEVGVSREEIEAAIAKFQEAKRIMYDPATTVVWVVHFRDYHGSQSPNWLKGVRAAVEKIPDCAPKRAYLEAWPIGTLPLALDHGDDGSDPGQPLTVGDLRDESATLDEAPGGSAKVATSQGQGQGQGQSQGQGQGQLEGQGGSQTDLTDVEEAFLDLSETESQDLKPNAEGRKALIRACIGIWEGYENRELTGAENVALLQFVGEYGAEVVLEGCQVTRDYKPKKSFGGYLRTILRNDHDPGEPDRPAT